MRDSASYRSLPYNRKLKERARALRKAGNLSEVVVWNGLKNGRFMGLDFDRQKIIGNYIVDFYCAERQTVLEVDGSSHDDKLEYDARRDAFLTGLGLRVIHVRVADVLRNLEAVFQFLRQEFEPLTDVRDHDHLAPAGHPTKGGEFNMGPSAYLPQKFPSPGGVAGEAGRGGAVPHGTAAVAVSSGGEAGAGRDNATPNAAVEYDRKVRLDIPHYGLIHEEIVDFAKSAGERFGTWLDTGCGTGALAARLLEERVCERMILADPSEAMLAIARERVPGARILPAPTAGIELEPGSIDAISAIQAHHYGSREDRRAALERCRALLRPGGLLVVSENVAPEDPASLELFLRRWGSFQVRSGKTPAQAAEHAARYGTAYFPIPVSEHLSLLRSTGFVRADLLWKSHMQAVLVAWRP